MIEIIGVILIFIGLVCKSSVCTVILQDSYCPLIVKPIVCQKQSIHYIV